MAPRKPPFLDEEAAVDDLAKGSFWDKLLISKDLFEIDKGKQKSQKPPPNAQKSGKKKNFHFDNLDIKKWTKVAFLRKRDRPKKIDSG